MSVKDLKCNGVKTITDQVDQKDEVDGGPGDGKWVSCGQDGSYNELQNKYRKHFSDINEDLIASVMCKCCKELKPTGREKVTWLEFYKCMKSRITSKKHPRTFKKLESLINSKQSNAIYV